MSQLPYHKRYHSDALAGFMPLSLEERGAYQTLLDMIYDRGGPIVDNERLLAGYMNCSIRKWRQIRDELIAKRKIRVNREGLITNSRAEKEIENTAKTSRKLSESGAKGGRTRAENEKKDNENNDGDQASLGLGLSEAQAIPETRNQKPERENNTQPSSTETARETVDRLEGDSTEDWAYQLCEIAGIPLTSPGTITTAIGITQQWLNDGIDLEASAKPTIRKMVGSSNEPTHSLRRFDKAVRHEHAKAAANGKPHSVGQSLPVEQQIARFEESATRFDAMGKAEDAAEFRQKADRLRSHAA